MNLATLIAKRAEDGLVFPPGSIDDVPTLARPRSEGDVLYHKGRLRSSHACGKTALRSNMTYVKGFGFASRLIPNI